MNQYLEGTLRVVGDFVKEHKVKILIGLGLGSMTGAVVTGVKNGPKLKEAIAKKKEQMKTDKLPIMDTVKTAAPILAPTVIAWGAGVACVIGGVAQSEAQNAALAAAYGIAETARQELRAQIKQKVGEEQLNEMESDAARKAASEKMQTLPKAKIETSDKLIEKGASGGIICYDAGFGRLFYANKSALITAMNKANAKLNGGFGGYISLNDFYEELGLEPTDIGYDVGWNSSSGLIDLNIRTKFDKDDETPIIVFDYKYNPPKVDYRPF